MHPRLGPSCDRGISLRSRNWAGCTIVTNDELREAGRTKMPSLNRSAIVVTPKQPVLDWLQTADPTSRDITLLDLRSDPAIYLIPQCDTDKEVADVLRQLCQEIFEEQLGSWYTDTSTWPPHRSFDVFCRWFDYEYHSMLIDLSDEPLIRDSD